MRLGLCASAFGEVSLPEVLRWAGENGFEAVEIECPCVRGWDSWHRGSALNVSAMDGPSRDAFAAALDKARLRAAALSYYANPLEADATRRQAFVSHLAKVVETAGAIGVGVVCLHVGRDAAMALGECIAEFARQVRPVVEQAEKADVRLAVETSPLVGAQAEDLPGNAAFSPELWEKLFTHVRSPAVGLAVNVGHLAWLGVDPLGALTDYAEKVFHVRASDAEVLDLRRQDCSILRPGGGWWRERLPGLGSIDWRRLIDRLHELRFDGAAVIVGNDAVWQGDLDKVKAGLLLAKRHLWQYLP